MVRRVPFESHRLSKKQYREAFLTARRVQWLLVKDRIWKKEGLSEYKSALWQLELLHERLVFWEKMRSSHRMLDAELHDFRAPIIVKRDGKWERYEQAPHPTWKDCTCHLAHTIREAMKPVATEQEQEYGKKRAEIWAKVDQEMKDMSLEQGQAHLAKLEELSWSVKQHWHAAYQWVQRRMDESTEAEKREARKRESAYKVRASVEAGTSPAKVKGPKLTPDETAIQSLMKLGWSREKAEKEVLADDEE